MYDLAVTRAIHRVNELPNDECADIYDARLLARAIGDLRQQLAIAHVQRDEALAEIHKMICHAQVLRINQVQMAGELRELGKPWPGNCTLNCNEAWDEMNKIDERASKGNQ